MPLAIQLKDYGGPEALQLVDVGLPALGQDELRMRQTAIGVNFHDVYVRSGLYRTLTLPGVPGIEAVGIVEAIGSNVTGIAPGDRIGYVASSYGAYAAVRNLPASLAIRLPEDIPDAPAAATLMKALTVCMLVSSAHPVKAGETILVHAAAGGIGQLLCSWARHLGARVIGTTGDPKKVSVALAAGAHEVILYRQEDVVERVQALTGGVGVAAAYDSVGEDTFLHSLATLDFGGTLVSFGQSSGPISPFAPSLLATRSLRVVRPVIFHYLRNREQISAMANTTFTAFHKGAFRPIEPLVLPLEEAPEAHRILEARQSPGGIVLVPASG